ncbi:MAG: Zn-dependent hydrolase [Bacteroidia bacterium]|nr:Zn-dependent hydrolase [Bacteroidia bacterium]
MRYFCFFWLTTVFCACAEQKSTPETAETPPAVSFLPAEEVLRKYEFFSLKTDSYALPEVYAEVIPFLKQAADVTDTIFQIQAYGHLSTLLDSISDPTLQQLIKINYGPYDRINNHFPLLPGIKPKPSGANFYPPRLTAAQFDRLTTPGKTSSYTLLTRDVNDKLIVVPYHIAFREYHERISHYLRQAAAPLPEGPLKYYLYLRADAFYRDQYGASEYAWLDNYEEPLDLIIGPMETYEDQFMGYKSAYQSVLLVKNNEGDDPAYFTSLVPEFQRKLPVSAPLRPSVSESPDIIQFYDLIYAKGLFNAGPKSIGLTFPSGNKMYPDKGVRRILLSNILKAKFEKIVIPVSDVLIAPSQRHHVQIQAFSRLSLFHEIAHGLGVKRVAGEKTTVQEALKQYASLMEEEKADVLGLYMIIELLKDGRLQGQPEDYYVTFLASVLRSARFGNSSDHGRGNMMIFNYFLASGAFYYSSPTGTYFVNADLIPPTTEELIRKIITIQGEGDFNEARAWIRSEGQVKPELSQNLLKLESARVPVDIIFEQ